MALSAFLILGQSSAWAKGKKANDLDLTNGSDTVNVIIQYKTDEAKGAGKAKGRTASIVTFTGTEIIDNEPSDARGSSVAKGN